GGVETQIAAKGEGAGSVIVDRGRAVAVPRPVAAVARARVAQHAVVAEIDLRTGSEGARDARVGKLRCRDDAAGDAGNPRKRIGAAERDGARPTGVEGNRARGAADHAQEVDSCAHRFQGGAAGDGDVTGEAQGPGSLIDKPLGWP